MRLAAAMRMVELRRAALGDPVAAAELDIAWRAAMERRRRPPSPSATMEDPQRSLDERALAWVQEASPELWGERWLVAHRALAKFDQRRGTFRAFLSRCWFYHRYSCLRASIAKCRDRRRTRSYIEGVTSTRRDRRPDIVRLVPVGSFKAQHRDLLGLVARGVGIPQAAASLGISRVTAHAWLRAAQKNVRVA